MTLQASLLAGLATGARSVAVLAALARAHRPGPIGTAASLAQVGEIVADKLPVTPSRLEPPGLVVRIVAGAATGAIVAGRSQSVPGALLGAAGSVAWSFAGARARSLAAAKFGNDLPGALAEDVLAVALANVATRRGLDACSAASHSQLSGLRRRRPHVQPRSRHCSRSMTTVSTS